MVKIKVFQKYGFELDVGRYINFAIDDTFRSKFNDGITVSFWYKGLGWGDSSKYDYLVHISSNWVDIVGDRSAYSVNRVSFLINESNIAFQWGVKYYIAGLKSIGFKDYNDGVWHHYVGVISEEYMRLYVDDILVGSIDLKAEDLHGMIDFTDANFAIPAWSKQCVGKIGEVRIYDRPLTQTEVQYLYKGGHIEDGLVFWLYPNEENVVLGDDGQTVLSVTERINGYVGTAYNGVKLVDGKDIDMAKNTGKRFLVIRKI